MNTDGGQRPSTIIVVAAAIVEQGRLLVVSKEVAPEVFYLPGGKPEAGESTEETLIRELDEELNVTPTSLNLLGEVEDVAAIEGLPLHMTVFRTEIDRVPRPAAEVADLRWTNGGDEHAPMVAPAVRNHVIPLLARSGLLASPCAESVSDQAQPRIGRRDSPSSCGWQPGPSSPG
ncbi:NUDIX domain-containing protein [Streptomyces sp. NPDC046197]|uniref:NUDIX hydrolase n=1 Tax=Streptomyces sp. NPDC046197 TaxID=3154337 RepID=UPI0034057A73